MPPSPRLVGIELNPGPTSSCAITADSDEEAEPPPGIQTQKLMAHK